MRNFIGIDLGTTNSVIVTYNGTETRIWKSPDQKDVTPSAIYIDKRTKYIGSRAYDLAFQDPQNAATKFKRFIGSKTTMKFASAGITMTPIECSVEILKTLGSYLPEEIRSQNVGTVITVPAAFNQLQKNATFDAAQEAGLGHIALMAEPAAAVMSIMKNIKTDGIFLVYDLGGGTLDITIAEGRGGSVSLIEMGGISVCGGTDFDRSLVDELVIPWMLEEFDLPDNFLSCEGFSNLKNIAAWAAERAKIELSSKEEAVINLNEHEIRAKDTKGREIYLQIPLNRKAFDKLIVERLLETVDAAKKILKKSGYQPQDMERIVFIGGPTQYKPLQDKIVSELGINGHTGVNPMTTVAEGASIFAETIDWHSKDRKQKPQVAQIGDADFTFNYEARTAGVKARLEITSQKTNVDGMELQVDNLDTGWTSGRLKLQASAIIELDLFKSGENNFKAYIFDRSGRPLKQNLIVITKTAAVIEAIPASHSIMLEVLDKKGGSPVSLYLVRSGDRLPISGQVEVNAEKTLKAGQPENLVFNLWEGDIEDPIKDNRWVGAFKISGMDIDGVIPAGAKLICDYEILDSGVITLKIGIPSLGATLTSPKLYSRHGAEIDYLTATERIKNDAQAVLARINKISASLDDPRCEEAREKIMPALSLDIKEPDLDKNRESDEKIVEALNILAELRKNYRSELRSIDLSDIQHFFDHDVRPYATPSEIQNFENKAKIVKRSIQYDTPEFENLAKELNQNSINILFWGQDWYVIKRFKGLAASPNMFDDKKMFDELVAAGQEHIKNDDIAALRQVCLRLWANMVSKTANLEEIEPSNIIKRS